MMRCIVVHTSSSMSRTFDIPAASFWRVARAVPHLANVKVVYSFAVSINFPTMLTHIINDVEWKDARSERSSAMAQAFLISARRTSRIKIATWHCECVSMRDAAEQPSTVTPSFAVRCFVLYTAPRSTPMSSTRCALGSWALAAAPVRPSTETFTWVPLSARCIALPNTSAFAEFETRVPRYCERTKN